MSSLVLMMIFKFMLTCLWSMWYHRLETHVKIDFQSLSFTVWLQFHHKSHTNCTNCWVQNNHMWWHSHNAAILVRNEETKHVKYEDDKREITNHENNADNNKKRNKNEKQKNQETQATHIIHAQIIKILKSLIIKNQIVFKQKIIKQ